LFCKYALLRRTLHLQIAVRQSPKLFIGLGLYCFIRLLKDELSVRSFGRNKRFIRVPKACHPKLLMVQKEDMPSKSVAASLYFKFNCYFMKLFFVISLSCLSITNLLAQNVGIGTTTPDASAQLDVSSVNKGVLVSRVSLSNVTTAAPVASPATGLLVYNTNAGIAGGNGVGFYYWTGTQWTQLTTSSGNASAWTTNGNLGTTAINFIGTTDANDLRFKVNNQFFGLLSQTQRNIALGENALGNNTTGNRNIAIGTSALKNNINRNQLVAIGDSALLNNGIGATLATEAVGNTAVGVKSLASNTIGFDNTALGRFSLVNNTTGNTNTAVGSDALFFNYTGSENIAMGYRALLYNQDGNKNVASGMYALAFNNHGNSNTAHGYSALFGNQTGSANVAVGVSALNFNNSRSFIVAIGDSALFNNGSTATADYEGTENVAVGSKALQKNTLGLGNTALGFHSLLENTTSFYNTATGAYSLSKNTTGYLNTANGFKALTANTTGNWNTAMGQQALYNNTSGNSNTGIGNRVLIFNTTGNSNTVVGERAMYLNTVGYSNVGLGSAALFSNDNRSNLVAIGDSALFNNGLGASFAIHATNNVAVGSKSLFNNTTGYSNTAMGYQTLYANVGGVLNTAVGNIALSTNMNGIRNTAMGSSALLNNTDGGDNTAIGSSALITNLLGNNNTATGVRSLELNTGNANTAFGYEALKFNGGGSYNTAIGNAADVIGSNLNYATAIGYNAKVSVNNAMVLGGTGFSAVNVGIGLSDPGFPLNFATGVGDKISLYGTSGGHYGFGVQSALLQIHSDAAAANIAFGYGSSTSFTERARIINQGEYGMTLTGRLQLRTGTNSAGLWLNNFANTSSPAFIGMAADDLVGFYGATGWGLTMSTTTGNVGIGLNTATPNRALAFASTLGEKILLYQGALGEVGIGVYGNELRLHADNANAKVSFGTQSNVGVFSENAFAQRNGAFAFSVLGSLWVNGTTYASDERFKQNITAIESPLQKLLQINGVEYEMKVNEFAKNHFTPGRQIGLLAQNVEKVVPEAVNEMDGYKGVDYAKLVPLLIEAIKEQQKQIEKQQAQINQLLKK
jgi:trimeric autotransporter adhesin